MHDGIASFLAAVVTNSDAEVAFFDTEGRYVFVSDALAATNGIRPQDHIGRTLTDVIPELAENILPLMRAALMGHATANEVHGRTQNLAQGERTWSERWFPVTEGDRVIGAGVVISDVTDVRLVEERAAQSAQQAALASLAKHALDDRVSLNELFQESVEALADVLQVPMARIVQVVAGSDELRFRAEVGFEAENVPPPGLRSDSFTDFVMNAGEPVRIPDLPTEQRFRIPVSLRQLRVTSAIGCGLRDSRGNWGVVFAHSRMRRLFTGSEAAFLQEMASALSLAIAVREARELQRDTISIASHELRTPLTSVIGLGQHLVRRLRRVDADESVVELAESVVLEGFRLNSIIDRWMGFAELQSGLIPVVVESLDLRDCVLRQVRAARERHPQMTINELVPGDPVMMQTDANKVAGILDNLLENAARYAGETAEVRVTLHVDRESARIAVVDNGPGISPENLPHLFDRFYRGTGRIKGGLGIGLYASRSLAEDLGGVLTAASEPGEGATFLLELPIAMPRWARPPISAPASGE